MEKEGKNICNQLKKIRQQIANENDIPLEEHECQYEGDCCGTCPRCDGELQYLEREMAKRGKLAKAALVAGMTIGLATSCTTEGDIAPDYIEGIAPEDTMPCPENKTAPSEDEAVYYGKE